MARPDAWQRLPEDAKRLFGIDLTPEHLTALAAFLDLLESWSARMNLIGKAARDEVVERHLLDSLAPAALIEGSKITADFGSGAGFPAIPLAVIRPDLEIHLVESRRKRASFLRQVSRSLRLANAVVWESRGEDWNPPRPIDVVIGRALAAPVLAALAARVLGDRGHLIVMRKQGGRVPVEGFAETAVEVYRLPAGDRHEVAAFERAR